MAPGNKKIIDGIKKHDRNIIKHLNNVYYTKIRNMVIMNTGTIEESKDVYQETLFIVYKKIMSENFKLTSSFLTFFYSVAKNQWLLRLREKKVKIVEFDEARYIDEREEIPIVIELKKFKQYQIYRKQFENLDERCREILDMSNKGITIDEIAKKLKIKSKNYMYKIKCECKKKLTEMIENDPDYKSLIFKEDEKN